ncbi:deoxyguanosinetriphosphate triphosphohydrolase [Candidatus Peregrinibacteria bacterium]|nr:MAG: deoxyguanosinetriphosphate triphosphohydrolase [Candidatus Peregrinibacteria bacterium]
MILSAQDLAQNEARVLKPYAVLSKESRGRAHPEPEDVQRLPFQKDRDRIIHCKAFRRLKGKTQVFVAHYGDHYRTRLSHSLEVAQVSRDLARMLGLNEDLAEAVSLAHDLGHTPFGHAGEQALDECLRPYGLEFEHNRQSRRIVEELEDSYPHWRGLNLSREVIEGLMKHETSWDHPASAVEQAGDMNWVRPSLEAQIVNFGDEIAYQNHDVDDGLRSGLFEEKDLQDLVLWKEAQDRVLKEYGSIADEKIRWSRTVSKMISLMIADLAEETSRRLATQSIQTLKDVYACPLPLLCFSEKMSQANVELKNFLMTRLYFHPTVLELSKKGQETIRTLFKKGIAEGKPPEELRDYIAGMTDGFASEA